MCWKKSKYILLLVIILIIPVLGWVQSHNSGKLWRIVHEKCVPHQQQLGYPSPCTEVNTAAGYVVFKDRRGELQYLLMPTAPISGIESPQLLSDTVPNFFYLAWQARYFLSDRLGRSINDNLLSLAVNSAWGRTQNHLHIHISCLRRDIREQLDRNTASIAPGWQPLSEPVLGHRYLARRISADDLAMKSPFLLLANEVPDAAGNMDKYGLALTPSADGSLVLLASRFDLWQKNSGSVEEIQDHACSILERH